MGKFKDLTGQKFGMLTVVERAETTISDSGRKRTMWKCRCDCGNEFNVVADSLTGGKQISCGCYRKKKSSSLFKTHGMSDTRLY